MNPAPVMPTSGLAYVLAAYGMTFVILGGYILSIALRRRAQDREQDALESPRDGADRSAERDAVARDGGSDG